MKRILLISNMYPSADYPSYGSFVKRFEESLLETKGVTFEKVVLVKTSNSFIQLIDYFIFYCKVIQSVVFSQYDLVYIHYGNHTLIPFILLRFFVKVPIVLNVHGSDVFFESFSAKFIGYFTRHLYRKVDKIVVPSEYFKEIVIQRFQVESSKLFVSPSGGVNCDEFNNHREFRNSPLTIGFLGRIDVGKGYLLALKAFSLFSKDTDCGCKLIVGGGGKDSNLIPQYFSDFGITDIAEYVGVVPYDKVSFFYKKVDLLLFPSNRQGESLGLVPLESMASGVPVIAFDNGAVREYILDEVNGFVFNIYTPEALALKIKLYSQLSEEMKFNLSNQARISVNKYDHKVVAVELLEFLSNLIK